MLASGDFNGDGKSDLAIGVPNFDIGTLTDAGVVSVIFGSNAGITTSNLQQLWVGAHFHPGVNEANARFGAALAAGDFNGDGIADLAIGVPIKDIVVNRNGNLVALADAGEVNVIYGSSAFLLSVSATRSVQVFNQDTILGNGHASAGARFGAPLTAWNFGRNELPCSDLGGIHFCVPRPTVDLAVGIPFQTVNNVSGAGAVDVIYGSFSANGLTVTGVRYRNLRLTACSVAAAAKPERTSAPACIDLLRRAAAAFAEKRFGYSEQLCRDALKRRDNRPQLGLNLAEVCKGISPPTEELLESLSSRMRFRSAEKIMQRIDTPLVINSTGSVDEFV